MLLLDNRGMDDVDPVIARSTRDLARAQSLRWRAVGEFGSDRVALLNAAAVLERLAVSQDGAVCRESAAAVGAADGVAHAALDDDAHADTRRTAASRASSGER